MNWRILATAMVLGFAPFCCGCRNYTYTWRVCVSGEPTAEEIRATVDRVASEVGIEDARGRPRKPTLHLPKKYRQLDGSLSECRIVYYGDPVCVEVCHGDGESDSAFLRAVKYELLTELSRLPGARLHTMHFYRMPPIMKP